MSTDDSTAERAQQSYAALGVGLVCILIGLPLWWKTTEVYRVELPYSDIAQLKNAEISYTVHFTVVSFDDNLRRQEHSNLEDLLRDKLKSTVGTDVLPKVHYRGNVRGSFDDERRAFSSAGCLDDLGAGLDKLKLVKENGKYTFLLLPNYEKLHGDGESHVGRRRYAFLNSKTDIQQLAVVIEQLLRQLYVNEEVVRHSWTKARGATHLKADKESMRAVHSNAKGYDVTFTLLNPQPDLLDVTWDVEDGMKQYLTPLLKAFDEYSPLRVTSQYLFSVGIGVRPERREEHGSFVLETSQLPHIINPVEAFLSSHVSNNPQLNFIVYVAPPSQTPLQIVENSGALLDTNAFMSPQWGGFLVHNAAVTDNTSYPLQEKLDMREVMQVFSTQLRLLLGVQPSQAPLSSVSLAEANNMVITDWELDSWLRSKSLENIATSTATLNSLAQLLEKIGNIVINDEIGQEVERSVASIRESMKLSSSGQLKDAFLASRKAMLAAEKAFFDPSLLELLYFPEDQKFAIYIPLFLPISIPVVMSTIQALKWLTGKDKEKQE